MLVSNLLVHIPPVGIRTHRTYINDLLLVVGKGEEIARVARGRTSLESISIYETGSTDKVMESFSRHCPSLRHVRLSHCEDISTAIPFSLLPVSLVPFENIDYSHIDL